MVIPIRRVIPDALADVVRRAPLCPEKVAFAWADAVGPALQRVTAVRLDERGVLHVTADTQWAREVRRLSPVILKRLQRLLGRDVVVSIAAG